MFRKGSAVSLLFVVFVALITYTCGDYKKVLKSTDLQYKYDRAIQYYDEGECYKAYPLFEELLAVYRGTKKSEDIYYRLAYCDYRLKDFILASHRFEQFYNNFPYSGKAEECTFMSAYCHYLNSPKPSLDQTDTEEAITAFRLFVNKYPYSPRIDTCNVLMDELRGKLETKNYEQAKLYFRTRNYKAAIVAYNNLLKEFPDTKRREEVTFMVLRSQFLLAENSVLSKKEARLEEARKLYVKFIDRFPESERSKDAESIYNSIQKQQQKLTTEKS